MQVTVGDGNQDGGKGGGGDPDAHWETSHWQPLRARAAPKKVTAFQYSGTMRVKGGEEPEKQRTVRENEQRYIRPAVVAAAGLMGSA